MYYKFYNIILKLYWYYKKDIKIKEGIYIKLKK